MSVRVGVAGVAGMGLMHLVTAPKIEGYELTAICDNFPRALENASGLAPDAATFDDLGAMCASGSIDALILATPNWLHADNVGQALEAGLHVYCEKPLGITVGECRTIAERARATGRCVQVGFQHRFRHGYASTKRIVDGGDIGALRRADLRSTNWFRPNAYFSKRKWRATWQHAGGGVLMLQAIHELDAYLWITGMPSRVTARAWRVRPDIEVEDDLYAVLEFPNGAHGMICATTLDPAGINRLEFVADSGAIRADDLRVRRARWDEPTSTMLAERTNLFEPVAVTWDDVEPNGTDAMSDDDGIVACHRDFLAAIEDGREPHVNPDEATRATEVCNAIYLSAVTGEPVDVPLDPAVYDDAFKKMCAGELTLPVPPTA